MDANEIVSAARETFTALGAEKLLGHIRFDGGHTLTRERFEVIIRWMAAVADQVGSSEVEPTRPHGVSAPGGAPTRAALLTL